MTRRMLAVLLMAGATAGAGARTAQDQSGGASRAFLREQFGLQAADLHTIAAGGVVARSLETSEGREVATLGVVRLRASASFYASQLRDIVNFKRDPAVLQIGVVDTPARAEALAGLTLDRSDIDRLRRCRPGDCGLQLPREAIERFARDVRWTSADAEADANRIVRHVLAEMVEQYRSAGDAALMTYHDTRTALSLANEFRAMVGAPPAVLARFPPLHRHLTEYPHRRGEGVDDIVYWSKEKLGPAVVVTVTHLAIAPMPGAGPVSVVAASKQLYGSRYFDSSLGLTILLEDPGVEGSYLVYVNRSRLDALSGFWGGLKRAVVRSRTRSAMGDSLAEARTLVDRRFTAQAAR